MDRTELYLKTAFCCMACDGTIAPEELTVISQMPAFKELDMKQLLNELVEKLKAEGTRFLQHYLTEVKNASLTEEEECKLASIAIQTIEADQSVEYNEVAFFKKIRRQLDVSDGKLITIIPDDTIMPDKEDYLLPDISEEDDLSLWNNTFSEISILNT